MKLCITGLNHRTAPVEIREKLAFAHNELTAALQALKGRPGMLEGMILSTCNRVEVAVTTDDSVDSRLSVLQFLAQAKQVKAEWLHPYLYRFEDQDAVRHLFRVASSLDSMVVGEPQILGQLKSAYALAKEHGILSGYLDALLTRAFFVAKRVRSETDIGQSAVSISFAAVELAREIFGSLANKKVLIVGAGKMSELAARHLRRSGVSQIYVCNRTRERAQEMAALFDGSIIEYREMLNALPTMDIVLTSSGAPHYLLHKEEMRRVIDARKNRPMFLIDIAVPRNIEPSVNEIDNIFLYDIDDLQRVITSNVHTRKLEAEQADQIITEEVLRMETWVRTRELAPVITRFQEYLEQVRTGEMQKARNKFGTLTAQQEEALESLTRGIVGKIAHGPISELRRQADAPTGNAAVEMIRRMFRLDGR